MMHTFQLPRQVHIPSMRQEAMAIHMQFLSKHLLIQIIHVLISIAANDDGAGGLDP